MPQFSIIDAISNGFVRMWHEKATLARMAVLPLLLGIFGRVIFFRHELYQEPSLFLVLLDIPWALALYWYLAQASRLYGFHERPGFLSPGENKSPARLASLKISLLYGFAFYMALSILTYLYGYLMQWLAGDSAFGRSYGMILFYGLLIWSLRYAILYTPIALGHHPRAFLSRTKDWMFPLRIMMTGLGIGFLLFLPAIFILTIALNSMQFDPATLDQGIKAFTAAQKILIAAYEILFVLIFMTVFNGALVFITQTIMTDKKPGQ